MTVNHQANVKKVNKKVVILSSSNDSWVLLLERNNYDVVRCKDIRELDTILEDETNCICIADLTNCVFSLACITTKAMNNQHVRWITILNKEQLDVDVVRSFIGKFCSDYFLSPIVDGQFMPFIKHQMGMTKITNNKNPKDLLIKLLLSGESKKVKRLKDLVRRVSSSDVNIFITGENGTKKQSLARYLWHSSGRKYGRFFTIDCDLLLTSSTQRDIFYHYFSNSAKNTENFKNETVYLKNLQSLPQDFQLKLLEFFNLDLKSRLRLETQNDIKIISSSSIQPDALLNEYQFNKELFYKLNIFHLDVPSLRERSEDIRKFAQYFLDIHLNKINTMAVKFSEDIDNLLLSYPWPNNLIELENQVKQAVISSEGPVITSDAFLLPSTKCAKRSLKSIKDEAEKDILLSALHLHHGQVMSAAKDLGISRATMYRLLSKHQILPDGDRIRA
ncbi:sigma-54-dependent transcriptional regulator [Photobacterium damselae]